LISWKAISLLDMYKFLWCLCFLCLTSVLCGQRGGIETIKGTGVEDLVREVFIKGNCRNVSNIRAIGNDSISIGEFDKAENIFGFQDGIIITTGDIELSHGPNTTNEASRSFGEETSDLDLQELATSTLFDVTGIEFDFVPISDRVSFRYVFASEEYCEFVGTSFNDVFGFFVSGPGINGPFDNNAINVASLVLSNENVSINTVNHLSNVEFYVSNVTNIDAENCNVGFNPMHQELIEYDGFTVPLVASFQVVPCETYRIRLVLGDVGDPNLDSAVFLESKSFDLGEKINIRAEVPGREYPVAYEGCVDGQLVFTRSDLINLSEECTIMYNLSPTSTAVSGEDFEEIPLEVTIPQGQTQVIVPINIIEDTVSENPEDIKLELQYACDCVDPSFSLLTIKDNSEIEVGLEEATVCAGQNFILSPDITEGVSPFEFIWSNGDRSDSLVDNVLASTDYQLTVTDFCGNTGMVSTVVNIQDVPSANISGSYDFCEVRSAGIPVILQGNPPWSLEYSIDGEVQAPITNILDTPYLLQPRKEGRYAFTSFRDAFCEGIVGGSAEVGFTTFDVEVELTPPSCPFRNDGKLELTQLDAIAPFTIEWSNGIEEALTIDQLWADSYTVKITDGNGCVYEKSFVLEPLTTETTDCIPVYIPNTFSPDSDGMNDIFSVYANLDSGIENISSFRVYSRWGELMYEQNNFVPDNGATGWRGAYRDRPVLPGVYTYQVVVDLGEGNQLYVTGAVTVLR